MANPSWPHIGYAIVPARYRAAWYAEALPDSVIQHAGLEPGTRIEDLDADIWERGLEPDNVKLLANHILYLVSTRLYHIGDPELARQPILVRGLADGRFLSTFHFATRTRNVLDRAVHDKGIGWLSEASATDFFSLRAAGPKTLLDFATVVEKDLATELTLSTDFGIEFEMARGEWSLVAAEFPVNDISLGDPRLRTGQIFGDSLGQGVEADLVQASQSRDIDLLQSVRRTVAEASEDLGRIRDQPLDDALLEFTALVIGQKAPSLAARLGWDGDGGRTLQESGELAGVTRERIRQLETKLRKAAAAVNYLPALDRAIALLDEAAQTMTPDVDTKLQASGVTARRFLPHGVATAARFFKREHGFVVGKDQRTVELPDDENVESLRAALRSITNINHVAPVAEIAARATTATGTEPSEDSVRAFLERAGVVWLDSSHTWFWDGTKRLRYINNARKVLSLENDISVESLRDGVLRHHRTRNMSLPREAFKGLCRAVGFRVEGGRVCTHEPIDPATVLGNVEMTLVEVLRENNNVLNAWGFRDACVERGINRNSFWVYLSYSPVLERLAPSVYAIRGSDVDPVAVSLLAKSPGKAGSSLQDYGWTRDGAVWLGYQVSRSVLDTGIVSVPKGIRDVIGECRIELYTIDGMTVGEFVANASGQAWGLSPFMARRGVERNDYIIVTVDTQLDIATAQVGTRDLLFSYQEGDGWGPRHFLEEATTPDEQELDA